MPDYAARLDASIEPMEHYDLSIVVPVFNEIEALPELCRRVQGVLSNRMLSYELILVDDGSSDGSTEFIQSLGVHNNKVVAVILSRNFGKEAALSCGLDQAMGDNLVIIDADLQDPPELIPRMLEARKQGYDVVSMRRRKRHGESFCKRSFSYLYYRLLQKLSDIRLPEDIGDFRLISRKVAESIKLLPERNRYMKGIFAWVGYRTIIIDYDRDGRNAGATKWGFWKLVGLAIEGITSFSVAPLRIATIVGSVIALFGLSYGAWIVIKAILIGDSATGFPTLVAIITLMSGTQLVSIGVLGEYIGKNYTESKKRPLYIVSDITRNGIIEQ